ncbi:MULTISPECIES: hypothetical protein [Xenorhabdus]|uniref:Hydroxymethylpyrimidine pyrophosphatase-like HAD family hydrolase n=1 Tax=Xenorhabdus ehlersii TaxID=290111 RepID=A0A2D0IYM4_9GAMM|nr:MULTISPECIES: hypothetical protein [Xenorhabdus]MBC8949955.1 hypothetical protein [Xenorhabdus sp. TS4]PHM27031.1 hypothetical protein Xehl_00017 [Xenorhabdus ehlersii]RKE92555.1 hydroxymethylpyrimidine pyrophosphatase-like HAD family hydrolase [Xenorhabdus ehlersii]
MIKPVFLTDLDDTLFQSRRKLKEISFRVGALDRKCFPHSYMTEKQSMLVDWLLAHAEVIPVTARNTEQLSRVQIPFSSWRIVSHGAVILTSEGSVDELWQSCMLSELLSYRDRLCELERLSQRLMTSYGIDAWVRIDYEYGDVPVFLIIKHRNHDRLNELNILAETLAQESHFHQDFYFHQNNNNLTVLPKCVDKGLATHHLLQRLRAERGVFPVIGLGDSLSDHRFMQLCDWFGMPQQSQFAGTLMTALFGAVNNE